MIENNIIQSLGAGSGIDTTSLVRQLTEIEGAAPQARIDSKRETTQTQISDFGLLKSALATLQDAAKVLTDPEGLFSKTASFTESDALVPTELDTDVVSGSYAFTVSEIAQSQSIAFEGFTDPTDAVGEGTITFRFGEWARNGDNSIDTTSGFSVDADATSVDIVIDSSNNSLQGLRDAINDAEIGVTASVVFDGSQYRLSLLADSGLNNQIELTVEEGGTALENLDASGLSRFAFNNDLALQDIANTETRMADAETQVGQDASLTLNGIDITRSSNNIDDIVDGLTLDLLKPTDVGETVTVTVSDDKTFAEQNIRGFVDAYNAFLEAVDPVFGITEQENEDGDTVTVIGSLSNDGLGKSLLRQIRATIAQAVPGLTDSNLTSLTNIGIRTELDGSLSIDEADFSSAFEDNFEDIQKLFASQTSSSDQGLFVNSFNDGTATGQYDVVVTTSPAKGNFTGAAYSSLDTTTGTYDFAITVDGTTSGTLTIPSGTYTETSLAAQLQTLINSDTALSDAGARVTVSVESGQFVITSNAYGTSSNVSFSSTTSDIETNLGLSNAVGTSTGGATVGGTINGVAAFGSANVLLPAIGEPGEGLALVVGETVTSATVNFSRGFAGELDSLIDQFLSSEGVIATREETLTDALEDLDEDQEALDRRLSIYEERLIQQYIAMERILSSLSNSGTFLDNLIDTLPFTANNDN